MGISIFAELKLGEDKQKKVYILDKVSKNNSCKTKTQCFEKRENRQQCCIQPARSNKPDDVNWNKHNVKKIQEKNSPNSK
jgi:hypothetical protein